MGAEIKIEGFDELAKKLREIVPAMRKRVIQNSLNAGARIVRDEARRLFSARFNKGTSAGNRHRKAGTIKKAISARVSKQTKKNGDLGAFVNVRPLKGPKQIRLSFFKQRGKFVSRGRLVTAGASRLNSEDPFYWRFLEFGWNPNGGKGRSLRKKAAHRRVSGSKIPGGKFLTDSVKKFPQVVEVFKTQVGRWLDKLNDGGKVQP